jgi:hypothetical protein
MMHSLYSTLPEQSIEQYLKIMMNIMSEAIHIPTNMTIPEEEKFREKFRDACEKLTSSEMIELARAVIRITKQIMKEHAVEYDVTIGLLKEVMMFRLPDALLAEHPNITGPERDSGITYSAEEKDELYEICMGLFPGIRPGNIFDLQVLLRRLTGRDSQILKDAEMAAIHTYVEKLNGSEGVS